MYRLLCMASKNNFPHAYLVELFRCTFYSVAQYFAVSINCQQNLYCKGHLILLDGAISHN